MRNRRSTHPVTVLQLAAWPDGRLVKPVKQQGRKT
jgi:hypothetical protein